MRSRNYVILSGKTVIKLAMLSSHALRTSIDITFCTANSAKGHHKLGVKDGRKNIGQIEEGHDDSTHTGNEILGCGQTPYFFILCLENDFLCLNVENI